MSPPDILFNTIPVWLGVYLLAITFFAAATFILYRNAIRLILLGQKSDLLDNKLQRFSGIMKPVFGQSKVLQSFSLKTDIAGLAHFFIFWGFLSFLLSYILFIYTDSIIPNFSLKILSKSGVKVFQWYLDIISVLFIFTIIWAIYRRWVIKPRRLSFDITQKLESALRPVGPKYSFFSMKKCT